MLTVRSQLNQMFWAEVRPGTAKKTPSVPQSRAPSTSQVTPLPVQLLSTTIVQPGGRPALPVSTLLAFWSRSATFCRYRWSVYLRLVRGDPLAAVSP